MSPSSGTGLRSRGQAFNKDFVHQIDYDEEYKQFSYEVDKQRRTKAEQLDGSYLLKTDRKDLSAEEAWRIYMFLTHAENAFRSMKTPLA